MTDRDPRDPGQDWLRPWRPRLPRYRAWAGLTLWVGATVVDILTVRSGAISLAGFMLAFVWSMKAPR